MNIREYRTMDFQRIRKMLETYLPQHPKVREWLERNQR